MKKIICLSLIISLIFCLASCKKETTFTWNDTLVSFLYRGEDAACAGQMVLPFETTALLDTDIFNKNLKLPDENEMDPEKLYLIAPEKAFFTDLEEEAWIVYHTTQGVVTTGMIVFSKDTEEERNALYQKVYEVLHQYFSDESTAGAEDIWFEESVGPISPKAAMDSYVWDRYKQGEKYNLYGYSLTDLEEYGNDGWRGLIPETARQYGFLLVSKDNSMFFTNMK